MYYLSTPAGDFPLRLNCFRFDRKCSCCLHRRRSYFLSPMSKGFINNNGKGNQVCRAGRRIMIVLSLAFNFMPSIFINHHIDWSEPSKFQSMVSTHRSRFKGPFGCNSRCSSSSVAYFSLVFRYWYKRKGLDSCCTHRVWYVDEAG